MQRLGGWVGRHALVVVIVWFLASVAGLGSALGWFGNEALFGRLNQSAPSVPSESKTADDLLSEASNTNQVMVRVDDAPLGNPAIQRLGPLVQRELAVLDHVDKVASPFMVPGPELAVAEQALVSTGDSSAFVYLVWIDKALSSSQRVAGVDDIVSTVRTSLGSVNGATVSYGGPIPLLDTITHQIKVDLQRGEGVALPLSLIVMVFVFGGFIAAGVPIVGALAAIAGGLAILLGFSHLTQLDATVVNIVTLLGLALSIDYGLLMVSRFREEIAEQAPHLTREELDAAHLVSATGRTVATAGRTVMFSGLTIGISIAGLIIFPAEIIRAVGIAGVSVVAVALLASLTLVPATCRLAGRRLVRRKPPTDPDDGNFARLARWVQRHKFSVIAGCVVLLLFLASPVLSMRQVASGAELLPKQNAQRVFLEQLNDDFPALRAPAATVVADATVEQATNFADTVGAMANVTRVDQVSELADGLVRFDVVASSASTSNSVAENLVLELRSADPGYQTWVTGSEARVLDFSNGIKKAAPWAILIVGLATIVLLFAMTGSLALPIKALIFNVVSLSASFGVMTWIFQNGHLESVLRFTSTGGVEQVVPVLMLTFGFGLAMDYEVFLLARIVELHEQGEPDARAVAIGVQRSGRIITSAALLVLIVLGGFAAARLLTVQQMGVGLMLSVALDATIVRMLLVPATMSVLGKWNWWAPGPLRRWHDRWGISESGQRRTVVGAGGPRYAGVAGEEDLSAEGGPRRAVRA